MKLTFCAPEHIRAIIVQPRHRMAFGAFADAMAQRREELEKQAWTLWRDAVPVGAMGLQTVRPAIYEAWGCFSTEALVRDGFAVARAAYRGLLRAEAELPCQRIQATILRDDALGHRWLLFLHFEREGVLQKIGPNGEDMAIYARVT